MLEINNIYKAFGELNVLEDVSLTVNKWDVVAILGPSRSGKTTLLRCINFLEKADAGTMDFDDIHTEMNKADKKTILEITKKSIG